MVLTLCSVMPVIYPLGFQHTGLQMKDICSDKAQSVC